MDVCVFDIYYFFLRIRITEYAFWSCKKDDKTIEVVCAQMNEIFILEGHILVDFFS